MRIKQNPLLFLVVACDKLISRIPDGLSALSSTLFRPKMPKAHQNNVTGSKSHEMISA